MLVDERGGAVLAAMAKQMQVGEAVWIREGADCRGAGQVGRFMGIGEDSGYLVPLVAYGEHAAAATLKELEEGLERGVIPRFEVSRPWPHEVVSPRLLAEWAEATRRSLTEAEELLVCTEAAVAGAQPRSAPGPR